ncbi:methyl-accepting chemotaxis protein [Aquabacterium sp.]|uniref:methyl-accepting chemotaxis protein n=1 Tax=Aquabacterium sp. TaxID=1872578 RepID=UPI0035B2EF2C
MASLFKSAAHAAPLKSPAWLARTLETYRYQGLMAPAVLLMRNIPVATKIALVTIAFLTPFAFTGHAYYKTSTEQLRAIQAQLRSTQYLNAVGALRMAVQAEHKNLLTSSLARHAGGTLPSDSVHERLRAVQRLDEQWGADLNTREALRQAADIDREYDGSAQAPLARRQQTLAEYQTALHALHLAARGTTGISLEGDGAEYRLMSIGLSRMPMFNDALFEAVIAGTRLLSDHATQTASAHPLLQSLGAAKQDWSDVKSSIATLQRQHPEMADELRHGNVEERVDAFLALANRQFANEDASIAPQEFLEAGFAVLELTTSMERLAAQRFEALQVERQQSLEQSRRHSVIIVLVSSALACYLLVAMLRVLRGGLDRLRYSVGRMAGGDLTEGSRPLGNDEVADTLLSLRESLLKLAELFTVIRQSVRGVEHATHLIADGNQTLRERTGRGAQSLEVIYASLDQFRATLDNCATLVNEALPRVHSMEANTARSIRSMSKLQARMEVLQAKSREIGDVVNIIDAIASQTNILALNASVEAARVGEAGKGFAVVANEVRALAQRSATAAEQIHAIVSGSIDEIEQSHRLAERAAESVQATADTVQSLGDGMNQIVHLMRPGQQHVRDVLNSLHDVHEAAAGHADLIAKLSTAADALRDQGTELSSKVAVFKLHD